jgi:homogentisate 1,2-dioxygenase
MPVTQFKTPDSYSYLSGFNNYHQTEAIKDSLPIGQNSPQRPPFGLFAEKLSGTAFTVPRTESKQTWLYRILPTAAHSEWKPAPRANFVKDPQFSYSPRQTRWDPWSINESGDWIDGLKLIAGNGDPRTKSGLGIYVYSAGISMESTTAFVSADGDLLIVPQQGVLDLKTELGNIIVRQNEICLIPRGVRYNVSLPSGPVRGYCLELYQGHFQLPELGPIGSDGLAHPSDFQVPVAAFEEIVDKEFTIVSKFAGQLFEAKQNHSCFDVVAWKGTYYPYKYDLGRFDTMGSISSSHPDPSIFSVLSAPSHAHGLGTSVADFVIFPPRWLVAEGTFRPPYYHKNCKSPLISGFDTLTISRYVRIYGHDQGKASISIYLEPMSNKR